MYNVFSNDLLFIFDKLNDMSVYNYDDDTTITCSDVNYDTAHTKLLAASDIMINWFENNNLKTNPNKFQQIVFLRKQMKSAFLQFMVQIYNPHPQLNCLVFRLINLLYSQNIFLIYA